MAFTRFHDDTCRIKKKLEVMASSSRYMLDVPGNGMKPLFMDDPFIRQQKWGANLMTNSINLESDLLGLSRNLNRDNLDNNYKNEQVKSSKIKYPNSKSMTEQTRSTNPAWMLRDIEHNNFSYLQFNPQENTCIPFNNNISSRIIQKNNFVSCCKLN